MSTPLNRPHAPQHKACWLLALAITAACMSTAACGASSDSDATSAPATQGTTPPPADDWPYTVDDYVNELESQPSGLTEVMDAKERECFARAIIEGIGLDRLEGAGATPEQLAEQDDFDDLLSYEESRRVTVDALVDCMDFHDVVLSQVQLPAADAQCLRDQVAERDLAEVLLGTSSGEYEATPEALAALEAVNSSCPQAMQALSQ